MRNGMVYLKNYRILSYSTYMVESFYVINLILRYLFVTAF